MGFGWEWNLEVMLITCVNSYNMWWKQNCEPSEHNPHVANGFTEQKVLC